MYFYFLLCFVTLLLRLDLAVANCVDVSTSEGVHTLTDGQRACAPLQSNETDLDKGRRFVTCKQGILSLPELCFAGYRFDTATNACVRPAFSSCALDDVVNATLPSLDPVVQSNDSCNVSNCQLPNCFCRGDRPSQVPAADMPMFITLTFDDAVLNGIYRRYYRGLLVDNDYHLFNPNGCRIKSALYVYHEYTNYTHVKSLWEAGQEIGSHTIHHRLPPGDSESDYFEMVAEIQGLKEIMFGVLGDPILLDSVLGFRAPSLTIGRDVMYEVLRDNTFLYDTSLVNLEVLDGREPLWPYTLDFGSGPCTNQTCPAKTYPGLWEFPLNNYIGEDGLSCNMIDYCLVGTDSIIASEQEWYDYFDSNFKSYYYPLKIPFPIFTHGFFFDYHSHAFGGLVRWLQDILVNHNDVWLVSPIQVIYWMQNQLSNTQMIAQKWGC